MKMMLNGAVTLGTLDGANVEIKKLAGGENIYIFGLTSAETNKLVAEGSYDSRQLYRTDKYLAEAVDMLVDGSLVPDKPRLFVELYNSLLYNESGPSDGYFVFRDFNSYAETHLKTAKDYMDGAMWRRKAIMNVAAAGYFSSDRAIGEYNRQIWRLQD